MRLVLNSLHDEVAAKLRERIFDGVLAPGDANLTFKRYIESPVRLTLRASKNPFGDALRRSAHSPKRNAGATRGPGGGPGGGGGQGGAGGGWCGACGGFVHAHGYRR